jgi:upstream activation factor subunit UAF30
MSFLAEIMLRKSLGQTRDDIIALFECDLLFGFPKTIGEGGVEGLQVIPEDEQGGKKRHVKADGESTHSNSVFLQPSQISSDLAIFCGVEPGIMLSRTDATRKIAAYIKEHDLQNPDNRREIFSDATLINLFALTSEDKLNYFNLQRYIKPHFIKEVKTVA